MVDVYSEAATFGLISANIRLIIMIVIAIVLIIIGISIVTQKVKRSKSIKGTITNSDCIEKTYTTDNGTQKYYSCTITVKANIDGREVIPTFTIDSSVKYANNQKIDLYYDPNDLNNIDVYSDNYQFWGWLIIAIAIILVIGAAIWALIVHKSKFAAAIGGGAEGLGIIGNVLGGLFGKK